MLRVMLVDEKPERSSQLERALADAGYEVVATLTERDDLRARIAALAPDVIIVDMQSPSRDVLEDMRRLHEELPRPVVMFVDETDADSIRAAVRAGVSAYVVDGLKGRSVRPVVEVAIARFQEFELSTSDSRIFALGEVASGDHDPTDGDHGTFFNMLPTNHIYYGFADQLVLQNLVDPFVQLRLTPHPMITLNAFAHWFRLQSDRDARYSGTGVYNLDTFGFSAQPSRGFTHVGREYDVVATLTPHRAVTIEGGWSWFNGGAQFGLNKSQQLHFGYVMSELKY